MKRAFKYQIRPNRTGQLRLEELLGRHCDVYNAAWQERRGLWRMGRVSVTYGM